MPNKKNGGETEDYKWTQTIDEVHVLIDVPQSVKGKNIKVDIKMEYLKVEILGNLIFEGKLYEKITVDESVWTLETYNNKKILDINLVKWPKVMHWWDCVIQGHQKINTKKINPETSNISDLDDDIKPTVEKMMFDMKQKQQGLPTSDELKKKDMLKGFMDAHPEMDFSKCKFN